MFFYWSSAGIRKIYAQQNFEERLNCITELSNLYWLHAHKEIEREKIDEFCKLTVEEEVKVGNCSEKSMMEDIIKSCELENKRRKNLVTRGKRRYKYLISIEDTA